MYGYIKPIKNQITKEQYRVYCAFFCGICKTSGKLYGQRSRFLTNFDITFLALILHDYTRQKVIIKTKRCILHPHKQSIVMNNNLMRKLTAFNVMLANYKFSDDILDSKGKKGNFKQKLINFSYQKAKQILPKIDEIISFYGNQIRLIEKNSMHQNYNIDYVSHNFAMLMVECIRTIIEQDLCENMYNLCYNIGKYIYLIDALDDIDEDLESGNFNIFLHVFGKLKKEEMILLHGKEIENIFLYCLFSIEKSYNSLTFIQSYSLTKNIVQNGMKNKFYEIFGGKK